MKVLVLGVSLFSASAALAQGSGVMAGMWDIAVTTNSIAMPDLPPGAAASMVGKTIHIKHCITPEEAARGPQEMMKQAKNCKFTNYSAIGGHISSTVSCTQPGGTMTGISTGTFTPTSFTTTGKSVMKGQVTMTTEATTVGKRVGACK